MRDPIDVKLDPKMNILCDEFFEFVLSIVRSGAVRWVWLAPPCTSFSGLQNGHPGGPWRSKAHPEGARKLPEIDEGNEIWRRTLCIIDAALEVGADFGLEHPVTSYAWKLPATLELRSRPRITTGIADMCMFSDAAQPHMKPLRILTSAPWVQSVLKRCQGGHTHAPDLANKAAAASAAYPFRFAQALAGAYARWAGRAPSA